MVSTKTKPKPRFEITNEMAAGCFTLEEYAKYLQRPMWQDDDENGDWDDEENYREYWVQLVDDWLQQSQDYFRTVKREWASATRKFEHFLDRLREMVSSRSDPAFTSLPYLFNMINEIVALLFDSLPRPSYQSRQAAIDDFAGALNYYSNWELDSNDFDMTMYEIGLDVQLYNLGVMKQTIEEEEDGPFEREGRIIMSRTEPRYCNPDPFAKKMDWEYMNYFIEASPYDVGDIRRMFPEHGGEVTPESHYSVSRADAGSGDIADDESLETHIIKSPANSIKGGPFTLGTRGRAQVKECWLKDLSTVFEADMEWYSNVTIEGTGEDTKETEINPGKGRGWMKPKVDPDTGYVMGKWKRKYPYGRYICTSNGVLLLDIPNPYSHRSIPYTFFKGRPSKQVLSPGDATFLILVERKLNDLNNRIFRMAQANIERPKLVDQGAFDAPKKYHNMEAASDLILQVRPNSQFRTMEAGEIPQFVAPFTMMLKQFFDDLGGVNQIMQGKLAEGSQLSAEAMGGLQDQASTRTRMKARFIEFALKHVGYQMMWNIRDNYRSGQKVMVIDPITQEQKEVVWTPEDAKRDDYVVVIQAGSSLPGAKQGAYQQGLQLYRERVVDGEYLLDVAQIPSAQRILQRQRAKYLQDIEAQAAGKALGLSIKEQMKTDERPGRTAKD